MGVVVLKPSKQKSNNEQLFINSLFTFTVFLFLYKTKRGGIKEGGSD